MPRPMDIIDPKKDLEDVEERGFDLKPDKKGPDEAFEIEQSKSGGTFYLILGIVALVVATVFAFYILYSDDSSDKNSTGSSSSATATATDEVSETPTAVAEESAATLVGEPTQTKTSISYSGFSVRIANGNGKAGEAARIKTILEKAGFSISSTGNATKTYDQTTIFYKSGKEDLANALSKAIEDEYSPITKESDSTVGSYDAVIALGNK